MTNQNAYKIKKTLSNLIGEPLRELGRSGPMIVLNFGELIEITDLKIGKDGRPLRDENGRGIPTMSVAGKYVLHSLCSMRLTLDDKVILAKSDVFLPTEEHAAKPDFAWETFDWHTFGNTAFDELVAIHFGEKFDDYIVKSLNVNKFGDLTITFENGFALEFFVDGSGDSENWRFGEINSTESLILTGNGIEMWPQPQQITERMVIND